MEGTVEGHTASKGSAFLPASQWEVEQYLKLVSVFETLILSQRMVRAYVHFYVALVQPPSNTMAMAAMDDGSTMPSAHRSTPYCDN